MRTAVKVIMPPDAVGKGPSTRVLFGQVDWTDSETRVWGIRMVNGELLVGLPDEVQIQLPSNVPVIGRLVLDDGSTTRVMNKETIRG